MTYLDTDRASASDDMRALAVIDKWQSAFRGESLAGSFCFIEIAAANMQPPPRPAIAFRLVSGLAIGQENVGRAPEHACRIGDTLSVIARRGGDGARRRRCSEHMVHGSPELEGGKRTDTLGLIHTSASSRSTVRAKQNRGVIATCGRIRRSAATTSSGVGMSSFMTLSELCRKPKLTSGA